MRTYEACSHQQISEMRCNLTQDRFRAVWIVDEEPEFTELVVDHDFIFLKIEVNPSLRYAICLPPTFPFTYGLRGRAVCVSSVLRR